MNAEAKREVEHERAVFHEQIFVACTPVADLVCRIMKLDGRLGSGDFTAKMPRRQGVERIRERTIPFIAWRLGVLAVQIEPFNRAVLLALACIRLGERDAAETHRVARLELPHFPKLRLNNGRGAHEAAEAWPVRPENDGHVAGEIHRAHRVGVVVDVRRMQPRLAAVRARPLWFWADEPHTGRVRVVVNFPRGAEEHLDVIVGKKIRRAVRAIEHCNVPRV